MAPPNWTPLLERALRVATEAHQGQTRKGSGLPYITHPVAVTMILLQHGFDDDELLAAALLHDVVEDTPVSSAELSAQFPQRVVKLIEDLSEQKRDSTGQTRPWEDRKRDHLLQMQSASVEARAIALADKLHNLESMLFDMDAGDDLTERFNAPFERLLWYHESMAQVAAAEDVQLTALAAAVRTALAEVRRRTQAGEPGT